MGSRKLVFLVFLLVSLSLYTLAQKSKNKQNKQNVDTLDENVRLYNLKLMSDQLQIPYDSSYNLNLLFESLEWIGSPYRYGLCSKDGTDCSGFTQSIYLDVYNQSLDRSSSAIFQQCKPVKLAQLNHGDMVFFKIGKSRISHVGVYIGYGNFIHASTSSGVIISNLDEAYYKRTYYSGGRLKKTITPK